jgi:hypothetical protein
MHHFAPWFFCIRLSPARPTNTPQQQVKEKNFEPFADDIEDNGVGSLLVSQQRLA